jgi:D-alanyl-D-alanine carboxypeptidase (penicillin-binding protein 5/6)
VTRSPFLDTTSSRRRRALKRRRRRRRRAAVLTLLMLAGLGLFATRAEVPTRPPGDVGEAVAPLPGADGGAPAAGGGQATLGPLPVAVDLRDTHDPVRLRFGRAPRAGLLVNLDTGEVLWRHRPERVLPIASLTKMMTALVTVDALGPADKAKITNSVLAYRGSGVGVLPRGKRVRVETLLNGLLLPSGNDAARALAFRSAGSISGMVRRMNAKAGALGMRCTSFASVEGLSPRNRSCPADLAVLARKVLDTPRLARIVRRRRAILPFPIKGGRVHLYNSNPLLRTGYPGIIGVKTGYTKQAGRCLVAAARRNGVRLAAILLRSPDPGRQAKKLLERGFRTLR